MIFKTITNTLWYKAGIVEYFSTVYDAINHMTYKPIVSISNLEYHRLLNLI